MLRGGGEDSKSWQIKVKKSFFVISIDFICGAAFRFMASLSFHHHRYQIGRQKIPPFSVRGSLWFRELKTQSKSKTQMTRIVHGKFNCSTVKYNGTQQVMPGRNFSDRQKSSKQTAIKQTDKHNDEVHKRQKWLVMQKIRRSV